MIDNIVTIDSKLVKKVEWAGNNEQYDLALWSLGKRKYTDFLVVNPWIEEPNLEHYINNVPKDTGTCVVWDYNDNWVAKYFTKDWKPEHGYTKITIVKPRLVWRKNSDLDRTMRFENDPFGSFEPEPWDSGYQLVWYMDPRVNPLPDKIWAVSCQPLGRPIKGIKDMGYVMPDVSVDLNPDAPGISVDVDACYPAYYDLDHECAYMLDPDYGPEEPMWLFKFSPNYRKPKDWKWYGTITPDFVVETNPDLPDLEYSIDYAVPWYDLDYEHVWSLDHRCVGNNTTDDIWAVKIRAVEQPKGIKQMGYILPSIFDDLDVIFISYNEPNAEINWARVLEKAPHAKRVNGVQGIFAAHCQAAELAETDMFYVVDGDAYLVDDFDFEYQPDIWNRDCAYIWHSKNPVNDLEYGYGGVKLLPKKTLMDAWLWNGLDMSTEVMKKLEVINEVSNITNFNTTGFNAWKSAFRECVKLSFHVNVDPANWQLKNRLDDWLYKGNDRKHGEYALFGAADAVKFVELHSKDTDVLTKINDQEWLEKTFKETYGQEKTELAQVPSNDYDRLQKIIPIVNAVSPTMCLAKWYHTTLYLHSGETHSCYHPPPHQISLEEIKRNPSALHNTEIKKKERLDMLTGVQTKGCQYCWNIENMGTSYVSDRHIKTASIYTDKRFNQASKGDWNKNVNPEYVEISFGSECNFKCGYCHPKVSSRFYNEIKQHGPVTTVKNHRCDIDYFKIYEREEENPYVDAWWKWWPKMRNELTILRITGGEPLMHVSTWKLLDDILETPTPDLELNINSNMGVKPALVEKMITKVNALTENKSIKRFKLFTSLDTWGPRAEYIRTGLDLEIWENNLDAYLTKTGQPISFMITFNILAVTTFKDFLAKILEWRVKYNSYNKTDQPQMIRFDTPYLKEPLQYDINILPKKTYMKYMRESLKFMEDNLDDLDINKFRRIEYEKFRRVVDYMESTEYDQARVEEGMRDFYNWFTALDQRRDTNFIETFPEMKTFFNQCRKLNG